MKVSTVEGEDARKNGMTEGLDKRAINLWNAPWVTVAIMVFLIIAEFVVAFMYSSTAGGTGNNPGQSDVSAQP